MKKSNGNDNSSKSLSHHQMTTLGILTIVVIFTIGILTANKMIHNNIELSSVGFAVAIPSTTITMSTTSTTMEPILKMSTDNCFNELKDQLPKPPSIIYDPTEFLNTFYDKYDYIKYQMGAKDISTGKLDCSGFVSQVFRDLEASSPEGTVGWSGQSSKASFDLGNGYIAVKVAKTDVTKHGVYVVNKHRSQRNDHILFVIIEIDGTKTVLESTSGTGSDGSTGVRTATNVEKRIAESTTIWKIEKVI